MAFQVVPNVASFTMFHGWGGAETDIVNKIYMRTISGAWTATFLTTAATAVGNAWRDNVMPLLSSLTRFDKVIARDEGAEFGASAVVEYNTVGGDVGDAASPALAALVKLSGDAGSAPRQGRLFIGGWGEASMTGAGFTAGTVTSLTNAMTAVDTAIDGLAQVAWVIVSRYAGGVKRAQGVSNTISARTVNTLHAIQRDRRPFEGS